MFSIRHALVSLLAIAFLTALPQTLLAGPICGPGDHWVDTCPGGLAHLITKTNASISLDLDRNGTLETSFPLVTLIGYTDVLVGAGTPHTLSTEIFNLTETMETPFGKTITLRAGDGIANGTNDGLLYSWGQVVEQTGNPLLADHTVFVMFEVDIPQDAFGSLPNPAMVLHNNIPLQATCYGLTQAPPDTCAYFSSQTLDLYDGADVLRGTMGPAGALPHHE